MACVVATPCSSCWIFSTPRSAFGSGLFSPVPRNIPNKHPPPQQNCERQQSKNITNQLFSLCHKKTPIFLLCKMFIFILSFYILNICKKICKRFWNFFEKFFEKFLKFFWNFLRFSRGCNQPLRMTGKNGSS